MVALILGGLIGERGLEGVLTIVTVCGSIVS
jgi:hypothetical protein